MAIVARFKSALQRPMSRGGVMALGLLVCTAPGWLFFDPAAPVPRTPLRIYRLHSDDFPYLASSRTLGRAIGNLFAPHNTHIVPAWRMLTWALVAIAGRLSRLPEVLAVASYAILVAVMLLTGRLVARESGKTALGLAAMTAVGTTSLMRSAATWYSAGQTLWAGYGVLATLWSLQSWRRSGGIARLILAALWASISGWFWTVGHLAGPVGAVYLWADGRPRCRKAAVIPLAATALAVALGMALGASRINSTISFHGRTTREAIDPVQGVVHTAQAIPEDLILGNLGLSGETTQLQGVVLSLAIGLAWVLCRRGGWRFNPLETAGAALLLGSYLIEWTVRGYLPFSSLRGIVPWYDSIPHIGAVLFVAGWWSGPRPKGVPPAPRPITRLGALGVILLAAALVVLNRPKVDADWRASVPPLTNSEAKQFPIVSLQNMRSTVVALDRAAWQRRHLAKLDQGEALARRLGIGRDAIRRAFGRLDAPDLPKVYDAIDLLDLPAHGTESDVERVRRVLGPYVAKEPDPRPSWLTPGEMWPPEPRGK